MSAAGIAECKVYASSSIQRSKYMYCWSLNDIVFRERAHVFVKTELQIHRARIQWNSTNQLTQR